MNPFHTSGANMINSRRAIVAALTLLALFLFITTTQSSKAQFNSPKREVPERNKDVPSEGEHLEQKKSTHVQLRPGAQRPMTDMSHMSTSEKLDYAYPYDVTMRFPAYIWQTWKTAPEDRDFKFKEEEESWTEQHPGFVHEVLRDDTAVNMLKMLYATVPEVLEAYHALPMPVLKADFFRYLILFARGGIYSDIDTYAIQSALEWIPKEVPRDTIGLVIGIEADPDRPDWSDWYSRRIQFCQWTIQAKPGHPVLREIISRITEKTLQLKSKGKLSTFLGKDVVDFSGPAVWTDVIFDYFNDERYFRTEQSKSPIDYTQFTGMESPKRVGDVVVLPITSFSPGVEQMGSKGYDDPMAFVKHDFEGSWKPESERHIGENEEG